tara:strand:+ start:133 stop:417 length:285 start_codon:yes stop_codon:yes gene_type:complete
MLIYLQQSVKPMALAMVALRSSFLTCVVSLCVAGMIVVGLMPAVYLGQHKLMNLSHIVTLLIFISMTPQELIINLGLQPQMFLRVLSQLTQQVA